MIETREFPETWTHGLRSPTFKSCIKMETCNYRCITVLQIFLKIFEISVQKRLELVNDAFRMPDRYDGGFLKESRTTDNLLILNGLIEWQLHMRQSLIVCHVDFTQAFGRVNRNILFYKIRKSCCTGRFIDTLQNICSKTRYRLRSWWRHQMETFFALQAFCVRNSTVTGEFHAQMPVTRSFVVLFDLGLNKLLSK